MRLPWRRIRQSSVVDFSLRNFS